MSAYDLERAKMCFDNGEFEGITELPEDLHEVVLETFKTGRVVEPPERAPEPPKAKGKAKSKKSRSKKAKPKAQPSVESEEADDVLEEPEDDLQEMLSSPPAAKTKAKKSRVKKRHAESMDVDSEAEVEYVPKKSKSRSVPFEEPAIPSDVEPEDS